MNEKHIWSKRPESMLDWFCVVGACIAFYLLLNNLGYFLGRIGIFINILSPFAGGIVIAYILDPMVKFFYTRLFKEKKGTRGFAILLAYAVAILLLMLLAIVVGGAWFGIPGMVLGVPTLAVLAALARQAVGAGLTARGLDADGVRRDPPPQ